MRSGFGPVVLLVGLALAACKSATREPRSPEPIGASTGPEPALDETQESPDEAPGPSLPPTPPEPGTSASARPAPAGSAAVRPPAPTVPERHGPPLPELRVKSFGLHIGGTARDAAERDKILATLEQKSWRYLECYQLVEQPGTEGTFGADLKVSGRGGRPSVGHVRTRLKGDRFRSCLEEAFGSVTFDETPSGRAIVVSYSVKFSFAW